MGLTHPRPRQRFDPRSAGVDKSSFKVPFYIRKGKGLKPAETLESDGHFLSVNGQGFAVNGQKPLANLAVNSHTADHVRTKQQVENGRKQSKPSTCDSPEEGCSDLYDKSERPGQG